MLRSGLLNRAAIIVIAGWLVLPVMPILAQSQLPACPTDQGLPRHMCYGTVNGFNGAGYVGEFRDNKFHGWGSATMPNGDRYFGEFRDDKFNGQGTYIFADGSKYEGEHRDGKRNGQGTWTGRNGERYVGGFRDGNRNGHATVTTPNGDRYIGEFRDNKRNGQGTYIFADGSKYEGELRDDQRNGRGSYTLPNGDKHVGEWRNNLPDGQGSFFSSDQRLLRNGIWRNGEFIQANNVPTPVLTTPQSPRQLQSGPGTSLRLTREGGTFKVPVRINGVLELQFTVDSGASDVTIPADVVMTLIRTGTISDSDFIGDQTHRLADGSTVRSRTFRIRQLQVGSRTVENVLGSVANMEGSLLLGQSFLSRFRRVSFDYTQGVLVLE